MESERELTQAYNKLREKQAIDAHDCCDKGQFLQQVRPKKGKKGKLIKQNRKRPSRPFKIGNNSQAKQKHEWESGWEESCRRRQAPMDALMHDFIHATGTTAFFILLFCFA